GARLLRDRQPLEGHLLAGRPEPQRHVRPAGDRGAAMSAGSDVWGEGVAAGAPRPFFGSRWVEHPAHVRELELDAGLPAGFRAAGVACGIKPSGNPDVGLLICDTAAPE